MENHSLKQEIILLNQKLKEKSKQLDSANSTIDFQEQYIDIVNDILKSNSEFENFFDCEFEKRIKQMFNKEQEDDLQIEKSNSKSKGMSM